MAELAKGLLRKKIPELELALEGKLGTTPSFPVGASVATTGKRRKKTWQLWNNASGRSLNPMPRNWPYWTRYPVWIGLWPP